MGATVKNLFVIISKTVVGGSGAALSYGDVSRKANRRVRQRRGLNRFSYEQDLVIWPNYAISG